MDNQMSLFRDKKITNQIINNLLEIKESYELPDKLMALLLDNNSMIKLFDKFMEYDVDLTKDLFRDYFQEQLTDVLYRTCLYIIRNQDEIDDEEKLVWFSLKRKCKDIRYEKSKNKELKILDKIIY